MKSRILKSLLYLLAAALLYSAIFFISSYEIKTAKYKNSTLKVTFEYPKQWKDAGYDYYIYDIPARYEGSDGFFQVGAVGGQDSSIYEVAQDDAGHKLIPYGSSPEIKEARIKSKEFVFIYPSGDQSQEMKGQACFIIKYPERIVIGDDKYNYFFLWADKDHIEDIASSFNFITY